jgi:hypothetical protein
MTARAAITARALATIAALASVAAIGTQASAGPAAPAAPVADAELPPLPPPPPPPPAAGPTAEQIDRLQQRLLASQQTIATLERELAEAKNRAVLFDECKVKNGRLVFIGRELIEGYEKRYHERTGKDPLQLGRRRFEFELQALSESLYDNRADVPVRVPGDKTPPPPLREATPASATSAAPQAAPSPAPGPATPSGASGPSAPSAKSPKDK